MSAATTSSVTTPVPTSRTGRRVAPRGTAGARWSLVAALVIGAAGGAGVSAALVHSQVHTRTVYVPVPSDPPAPASGNLQRKV